jgi:Flp pilus assembly protein TadD
LGQWDTDFLGHPADGARLVRMGYELSPGDPTVCFILATAEAEEGNWSDSVRHFQRAAELEPSMFRDAADLFVSYYHRPDAAVQLAGDDVEQLRLVSSKLRELGKDATTGPTTGPATRPADEQAAMAADARADALVRAEADLRTASSEILNEMGMMCVKKNDLEGACKYLGRALTLDHGQQDWRMVYAQCLAKIGKKDDAARQARIILHARPGLTQAQDLLDSLTDVPTTQSIDDLLN